MSLYTAWRICKRKQSELTAVASVERSNNKYSRSGSCKGGHHVTASAAPAMHDLSAKVFWGRKTHCNCRISTLLSLCFAHMSLHGKGPQKRRGTTMVLSSCFLQENQLRQLKGSVLCQTCRIRLFRVATPSILLTIGTAKGREEKVGER